MERVLISTGKTSYYFDPNDHMGIYEYLRSCGYDHDDASNVDGWADLASVGESYDLAGATIEIV